MKINFWTKYKYDITGLFLWLFLWMTLAIRYEYTLCNWQTWVLILIITAFRYIGYREGRHSLAKQLLTHPSNIDITVSDDAAYEYDTCELKEVSVGMFFSIANDKHQDKYLKCNNVNNSLHKCWNFNTEELVLLDDNIECILYKTKMLYIPVVKMKEDNNE